MDTYTAFAHDSTGHPGPDPITGDDGAYDPDGIAVEDVAGRWVTGKNLSWPSGKFAPDLADETLERIGFRRTGPWEWLGWDWKAPAVTVDDAASMEIISLPDGHMVFIPGDLPEEGKAEIRRLTAAERDRQEGAS